MNAFMRTLAVLLPVVVLWGCSTPGTSTGEDDAGTATTGAVTTEAPAPMNSGVEVAGIQNDTQISGDPLNDPDSLLSKRTVYFDFDMSEIKPEALNIVEAHARYLADNPSVHIVLEGHADERGTREYNLSLGERRAKAVQRVMTLMGVSPNQLELVSYGEERPAAMGHNEAAWALNRRVEFVY